MRKLLRKLLQILDGTPAVYGKRQSGQSVVELALITPFLIMLLAGLTEIGWGANNYLNLLDVTRVGARRGTVLQDQQSPLFWENKYSYVPNILLPADFQMVYDGTNGTDAERFNYRWYPDTSVPGSRGYEPCDPAYVQRVFYNEIICTMITSFEPLVLDYTNGIDDIIISGFSLQMVDPSQTDDTTWWLADYPLRPIDASTSGDVPQMVVAGRYPSNANECDVMYDVTGTGFIFTTRPGDYRDPFDINNNFKRDVVPTGPVDVNGDDDFTEREGYDDRQITLGAAEKQVGFSLFGNHKLAGTPCVGSEWTMREVEDLVNLPNYELGVGADGLPEQRYMPSEGLILVEMYWDHEMLLKIPLLSPVYTVVGNSEGRMVLNVWAAFPLPTVQPFIIFPCPPPAGEPAPTGCS
jgi:hypothetical protein